MIIDHTRDGSDIRHFVGPVLVIQYPAWSDIGTWSTKGSICGIWPDILPDIRYLVDGGYSGARFGSSPESGSSLKFDSL